jgi:hypothetical protein
MTIHIDLEDYEWTDNRFGVEIDLGFQETTITIGEVTISLPDGGMELLRDEMICFWMKHPKESKKQCLERINAVLASEEANTKAISFTQKQLEVLAQAVSNYSIELTDPQLSLLKAEQAEVLDELRLMLGVDQP